MPALNETHDPKRLSFEPTANGHPDFPIQNLPLGVFSPPDGGPRGGIAIGDAILDLSKVLASGLVRGSAAEAAEAAAKATLNDFLALGSAPRAALRSQIFALLSEGSPEEARLRTCMYPAAACTLHLPTRIGNYTDFYVGIHHATSVGRLFRPENPLLPNYKYVPIGYHGRASSIRPSGFPVRRPRGQLKSPDAPVPAFEPSRRLDYELELGVWIGPGNELGDPIGIGHAAEHVGGYCLLNDWSARDVQAWEYQPLGPFLAKNFSTTVSPWIITPEALAPFRVAQPPREDGDPAPLSYLLDATDQKAGAFDLELEVLILTSKMRAEGLAPHRLALSNARHMYWTVAQMIAHHTSNGCNLQPGDLLGTGTISGQDLASCGSLLETSQGGKTPVRLPSGEERRFLEDGDEVIMHARGRREGFVAIGFGPCRATILPAPG